MKRGAAGQAAIGAPSLDYGDITSAIEKRLFIGKVPPGSSEDELRAVFEGFGTLTECRLVPDRGSGANGIGFVGFSSWGAAHRALLETDGKTQLKGHEGTPSTLVVSFAERTSIVGRGGGLAYAKGMEVARVFVGSLPDDITENELIDRFRAHGAVEGANLLPAKSRLRCAFVNYQIWGEAFDAVEKLHGQPLRDGDEPMTVVLAQPKEGIFAATPRHSDRDRDRDRGGRDGIISSRSRDRDRNRDRDRDRDRDQGGLELTASAAKRRRVESAPMELTVLLAAYAAAVNGDGPRSACDILHEQLMRARDQQRAIHSRSSDRLLVPTVPAVSSASGDRDSARLFVGGLPHDCIDEDLASLAGQLQFSLPPKSCQLLECRVLPNKGCGYLRYASWEAAEEAFAALQGRQVEGWTQVLRVQWATPKPGGDGDRHGHVHGHGGERNGDAAAVALKLGPAREPLDPIAHASQAEVEGQGLEPTRLFVGQIARDVLDAGSALRPLFTAFGQLQEFRWVQEKGVLYASYSTFSEAQAAMRGLGNRPVPGVSKALNVRFSQRRY